MTSRRAPAGLLAAAALLPPLFWLSPALFHRQAPTFRDQGDFFFPLKLYTADRLRRGELPLWNPLSGAGEPWLANLQSGVFYPPGLLFLLPSPALAAALFLFFHFAVAAWGTRAFLKGEGASDAAALAGSAAFAASGFAASFSSYWNHFGALAFLPGLAALARGGLQRRIDRILFALLVALQVVAGSPELSLATFLLCAVLVWKARAPELPDGTAPRAGLRLSRVAVSAALGLLVASAALVPFLELASRSERRGPLPVAEREGGSVGWTALSSAIGRSPGSAGTSYLSSVEAGALALLLAGVAFAERERRPLVVLLAAVGAAGILLSASGPPGPWLRAIPPLDRFRYPAKALALPAFSLAILAGLGLDGVRFSAGARRRGVLLAIAVVGIALIALSRAPGAARAVEAAGLAAILLVAVIPLRRERLSAALQILAALLVTASLAFEGERLFRFAPEAELLRRPPDVAYLAALPGRVLTPPMANLVAHVLRDGSFDAAALRRQRESLLGYANLPAGVRTVRTASPLPTAAARRIADAIDGAADLQRPAGAASARVLWTPFLPPNMGSRRVGEFYRAPINPYRPRLSFVRAYAVEKDAALAWSRAAGLDRDPVRTVALDREPSPAPLPGSARNGFVLARIAEERPERVVAEVNSDAAGILVLTDLAYPGWTAEADGHPAEILVADGVFRAVALTAGAHRVVFSYRPLSLAVGLALSAAAVAALLLLARAGEPRGRRAVL